MAEMTPKQVVSEFVELFYGQTKVREAFTKYVKEDYIQHNPIADDGRNAAIEVLERVRGEFPGTNVQVKRIIAEGDLVVVHSHGRRTEEDLGAAIVDIFRVEEGMVAEHWDVVQMIPEESLNGHDMV